MLLDLEQFVSIFINFSLQNQSILLKMVLLIEMIQIVANSYMNISKLSLI